MIDAALYLKPPSERGRTQRLLRPIRGAASVEDALALVRQELDARVPGIVRPEIRASFDRHVLEQARAAELPPNRVTGADLAAALPIFWLVFLTAARRAALPRVSQRPARDARLEGGADRPALLGGLAHRVRGERGSWSRRSASRRARKRGWCSRMRASASASPPACWRTRARAALRSRSRFGRGGIDLDMTTSFVGPMSARGPKQVEWPTDRVRRAGTSRRQVGRSLSADGTRPARARPSYHGKGAGSYQIGLVQARSWMVFGMLASQQASRPAGAPVRQSTPARRHT
jgi:hypothetical protein